MNYKQLKLKKYLLLISMVFFISFWSHLVYMFYYHDSKKTPMKWWSISEWLIWDFPSLNPLKPLKWNNEYIVKLLYRSLLKYDYTKNKIVSDLADCKIDNLLEIECSIADNMYWSNGDKITINDILSTYNILQEYEINPVLYSLLNSSEIIKKENSIIFKNINKDINYLNIFFQPIISQKILDKIENENLNKSFSTSWQLYSWDFVLSKIENDRTINITNLYLNSNPFFINNTNIDTLILRLFPNTNSLLKNKQLVHIYSDENNLIWDSITRLENIKFKLPKFVWLFINKNKIRNKDLRNYILNKINRQNLINVLWSKQFKTIYNPFFNEIKIDNYVTEKNFGKMITELWYYKKDKIVEMLLPNNFNKYSNEVKIQQKTLTKEQIEKIVEKELETKTIELNDFQEKTNILIGPKYIEKYNFVTKWNILLTWKTSNNVENIYINDYKLSNYKKWDSKFYYRLKESYQNIQIWENNYKIFFEKEWKKELVDNIDLLYYNNQLLLDQEKTNFLENLYKINRIKELNKELEINNKIPINNAFLTKLNNLDEKLYYNIDLEELSLNLFFIEWQKELEQTAIFIKDSLYELSIKINLHPINSNQLSDIISNKNQYDLFLSWINLWVLNQNIFPYFHSSQSRNWPNFSNIKKTWLDIFLEEIKSSLQHNEFNIDRKNSILKILKEEQVVKTLFTPINNLLVSKNLINTNISSKIMNISDRKIIYNTIYTKEQQKINYNKKWFFDFINFLYKKLNV